MSLMRRKNRKVQEEVKSQRDKLRILFLVFLTDFNFNGGLLFCVRVLCLGERNKAGSDTLLLVVISFSKLYATQLKYCEDCILKEHNLKSQHILQGVFFLSPLSSGCFVTSLIV